MVGGLESAAVLQHIRYWSNINASDPQMFRDGRVWVYASRRSIGEIFPCISEQRIKTILTRLVEDGYLIKGDYSLALTYKATWFSLSDMAKSLFEGTTLPLVKSTNGLVKSTNDKNNINKKEYTIEEKQKILRDKCEPYVEKYGREMIEAFLNHWGQVNGNLLLCEITKRKVGAFDIPRRLATWASKEYNRPRNKQYQTGTLPQPQPVARPQKTPWEELGLSYEEYQKVIVNKL